MTDKSRLIVTVYVSGGVASVTSNRPSDFDLRIIDYDNDPSGDPDTAPADYEDQSLVLTQD